MARNKKTQISGNIGSSSGRHQQSKNRTSLKEKVHLWQLKSNDPALSPEQRRRIVSAKKSRDRRQKLQQRKDSLATENEEPTYKLYQPQNSEIKKTDGMERMDSNNVMRKKIYGPAINGVMWPERINFKGVYENIQSRPQVALMNLFNQL